MTEWLWLQKDDFNTKVLKNTESRYNAMRTKIETHREFASLFTDINTDLNDQSLDTSSKIVSKAKNVLSELKGKPYKFITQTCVNGTSYAYALQILLASKWAYGNQTWVIDGILWTKTKEAVRTFQNAYSRTHKNKLPPDSIFGPMTLNVLLEEDATTAMTSSPSPTRYTYPTSTTIVKTQEQRTIENKINAITDSTLELNNMNIDKIQFVDIINTIIKNNITSLDVYSNQIKEIPQKIEKLVNLQHLNLWANQIKEISETIFKLTQLHHLNLSRNQIKKIPAKIDQLTNLQHLDLSWNELTEIPAEIDQLTNLQYLDLHYNRITKIPAEIGKLGNLKNLDLSRNKLTEIPAEIGNLGNLEELNLWWNPDLNISDGSVTIPFDIVNITPPPNLKHISVPSHRSNPNDTHYAENQEFIRKIPSKCEIKYE